MDSTLNGLILGESLLNDAVAVVLSNAIENYIRVSLNQGDSFEWQAMLTTLLKFLNLVFGSVFLGFLISALTALLTKFTKCVVKNVMRIT